MLAAHGAEVSQTMFECLCTLPFPFQEPAAIITTLSLGQWTPPLQTQLRKPLHMLYKLSTYIWDNDYAWTAYAECVF